MKPCTRIAEAELSREAYKNIDEAKQNIINALEATNVTFFMHVCRNEI